MMSRDFLESKMPMTRHSTQETDGLR
jgi:hypothetical protein